MAPKGPPSAGLAAAIRDLRAKRGWSQEELAYQAGVTLRTLQKIEGQQSNPTWTTVEGIATALGVTMAKLGALVDSHGRGK